MAFELVAAQPEHVPEIGRICYEAFKEVSETHGFEPDLPTLELAQQVLGMLVQSEGFYGVVALQEGRLVGSNFLSVSDPVAGVGPITIDPACQGKGIGRALMQDVLQYAEQHQIGQVRLLQDSFNVVSLSLYASLGFEAKEEVALMQAVPAPDGGASAEDESVRLIAETDLPAVDELSRRIYKTSRRGDIAAAAAFGFPAFLRERQGRITGYLVPSLLGHGVAETEEDALALVQEAARHLPPPLAAFFCPLSEASLFCKALRAGCRVRKVMTLMALGPYEPPEGVWMPSVAY